MRLHEVLENKYPFKRKNELTIYTKAPEVFSLDDITSDDWESVYPKIELNRHQFFCAVAETLKELGLDFYGPFGIHQPKPGDVQDMKDWSLLADKLGFPK